MSKERKWNGSNINGRTATILRRLVVQEQTGLTRSVLFRLVNQGDFPRPIALTRRARGWIASEVDNWVRDRIEVSRAE